jgi:hypothetical protein
LFLVVFIIRTIEDPFCADQLGVILRHVVTVVHGWATATKREGGGAVAVDGKGAAIYNRTAAAAAVHNGAIQRKAEAIADGVAYAVDCYWAPVATATFSANARRGDFMESFGSSSFGAKAPADSSTGVRFIGGRAPFSLALTGASVTAGGFVSLEKVLGS